MKYIMILIFYILNVSASYGYIKCNLKFNSYSSPNLGGCTIKISKNDKLKYNGNCNSANIPANLHSTLVQLKSWLLSKKDTNILLEIKKKDKSLEGTIESLGLKSAKTPAIEVLTEMSETINIIGLKKSAFNNSFEGRYPVGTGGRPVNEIPLPFNTIKINVDDGRTIFNNELGKFNLRGVCVEGK